MTVIPIYNVIVLPGVTFYFQKDFFRELTGKTPVEGEELLFLHLKSEKKREELTVDDIYPIGVHGFVRGNRR